ncbi:MAG: translational GTPase TypA, partial [Clostridia bacterium]
ILAKNTAIHYLDKKINIIDTPGHADFGGEVERVLKMVSGVLLLVDAVEGPMPQTRFVLTKALALGLKIIICVNKIDRPDARVSEVVNEVLELLLDLNATAEQLDSPIVYCSGRQGISSMSMEKLGTNLLPLFDTIVSYIDCPEGDETKPAQLLISAIDYNSYVGRIGIGRIERGVLTPNFDVMISDFHGRIEPFKGRIVNLYQIEGLKRVAVEKAIVGDIVCVSGIEDINIGNTVASPDDFEPLPFVKISEPTVEMTFSVNDSPFAGKEGKYVTSQRLKERLYQELLKDVSLRVEDTSSTDSFKVCGRGEMHLSILIETMRREGFEFAVSTPKVLFKKEGDKILEPIDHLVVDIPQEAVGAIMGGIGSRRGELTHMQAMGDRMRLEFDIPSRGLFGYKNEMLNQSRGEGVMSSIFLNYQPYKGDFPRRTTGSLVSFEAGEAVTYGLFNAQERGVLFITPGEPVYEGMVVGYQPVLGDIVVNVCKKKHLTNTRSSASDDALRLIPVKRFSLEECLEFIADDELLEVTPKSLRIRKRILKKELRMKARFHE